MSLNQPVGSAQPYGPPATSDENYVAPYEDFKGSMQAMSTPGLVTGDTYQDFRGSGQAMNTSGLVQVDPAAIGTGADASAGTGADTYGDFANSGRTGSQSGLITQISVGPAGRQGLWGVASSILGLGASDADISKLTNQLIAANPGVTNDNLRQGDSLNIPTADTPTNSARAQELSQQYQARQAAATQAALQQDVATLGSPGMNPDTLAGVLQNQRLTQPLTVGDLAQMQGVSTTSAINSPQDPGQAGPSRWGQALSGVENIVVGSLVVEISAGGGIVTAETGVGPVAAIAGTLAGTGMVAAGVTQLIGAITGQTHATETGAAAATVVTSASGATTMIVTGGDLGTAQKVAGVEGAISAGLSFSSKAGAAANVVNAVTFAKGLYDLTGAGNVNKYEDGGYIENGSGVTD
jgi:hypothetical protein